MKIFRLACLISFTAWGSLVAQVDAVEPVNYIVVIGAFSSQENANRFVKQVRKYDIKSTAELNKIRDLYYVHVMQTGDKASAVAEAERIKSATPLADTWVYNGSLGDVVVKVLPTPVVETPVAVVATEPPPLVIPEKTKEEKIKEAVDNKSMVLKKGSTETLNYIYFFRDAAVLRPESKYEVDHLVRIMNENPTEKIRIHGHTNGNDKGMIIRMKKGSTDFFSLDNTEEDSGSAILLSELRADAILRYLVSNGIDANRISIKAWGGKKPLYEVDDEKAEANVRVEIEVLHND